jgi:hypothetical protein
MPQTEDAETQEELDAAIARVLGAERAARAAIAACEHDGEVVRAEAQQRARRIAERATSRIAAIHTGMAAQIAERVAAIEAERSGIDPQTGNARWRAEELEAAVARLADALIGRMP